MTLTNQELNEAIRTAQEASTGGLLDQSNHLAALRAEQLRRANQPFRGANWEELLQAATAVSGFDWDTSDHEAFAAMSRLRTACSQVMP